MPTRGPTMCCWPRRKASSKWPWSMGKSRAPWGNEESFLLNAANSQRPYSLLKGFCQSIHLRFLEALAWPIEKEAYSSSSHGISWESTKFVMRSI